VRLSYVPGESRRRFCCGSKVSTSASARARHASSSRRCARSTASPPLRASASGWGSSGASTPLGQALGGGAVRDGEEVEKALRAGGYLHRVVDQAKGSSSTTSWSWSLRSSPSEQGLRHLYVALTRPTKTLVVIHARSLPSALAA